MEHNPVFMAGVTKNQKKSKKGRKDISVGVVGGGVSGLAFAFGLSKFGISASVFDTGKHGVGGRCSSKFVKTSSGERVLVDHACQLFTLSNHKAAKDLIQVMEKDGAVTRVDNIVRWDNGNFKTMVDRTFYAGNSKLGMNSICRWLAKKCAKTTTFHQDVWISKLFSKEYVPRNPGTHGKISWLFAGKGKKKHFGPYKYAVIAHNGKCADRLMRTSKVKTRANPILKCKFVANGSKKDSKCLQLKSLFVVIVEVPREEKTEDMFTGCFIGNNSILSFAINNTAKYKRKGQVQLWSLVSSAKYASKNKCPQENIPEPVKEKVGKEMCTEFLSLLREFVGKQVNGAHRILHVQLWGAALPCNRMAGGAFLHDQNNQIGVVGDWFVSPSIEGALMSGLALGQAVGMEMIKTKPAVIAHTLGMRGVPKESTFSPVVCSDIGMFRSLSAPNHPFLQQPKTVEKNTKAKGGGEKGTTKKKGGNTQKNKKKNKNTLPRPNYFLSVRINSDLLKRRVRHILDLSVLSGGSDIPKCIVPVRDLHLTLFVFHLSTEEEIDNAREMLASTEKDINNIIGINGLALTFENVSSFRKDVIYVDIVQDDHYFRFVQMANFLYSKFFSAGLIQAKNGKTAKGNNNAPKLNLKPHVTLLKTSKARFKRGEKRRKISLAVPELAVGRYFGTSQMNRVELSAMQIKDKEGYYACKGSVDLPTPNIVGKETPLNAEFLLASLERISIVQEHILKRLDSSLDMSGRKLEALESQMVSLKGEVYTINCK